VIWLLPLAFALPLGLAAFANRRWAWWVPAFGAIPALVAVLLVPVGETLDLRWLMLGTRLGLDEIGRIFLLFTSIIWLAAGIYAVASRQTMPNPGRFNTFFLLAMAGNFWLIVGQDLVSFYTGFAIMGISSYGLVIHDGDRAALRAGKVYLILTLGSELALFVALVMIATTTGSMHPTPEDLVALNGLTIGLLILGLAVKAGLVPLHVWLPLAHPAAPIPASAVLSGAMIKVALLGWLRFLPIGEIAMPEWGLLFVFAGLATALYAVPIGLVQSNAKVLLAYSSVAKMGLMVVALGLIFLEPELAPVASVAVALYAGHHALTKGGLFLGVGLRKSAGARRWVFGGLVLLALSMAAVPLTSGAVAKYGIKPAFAALDSGILLIAIALTTITSALLMMRFLWIMGHVIPKPIPGASWSLWGWVPLVGLVILYPLILGSPAAWVTDVGLILLAILLTLPIALVALRRPAALAPIIDSIKPGDLLGLVRPVLVAARWSLRRVFQAFRRAVASLAATVTGNLMDLSQPPASNLDARLTSWPLAGGLWLGITIALITLAMVANTERAASSGGDHEGLTRVMAPGPAESVPLPDIEPSSPLNLLPHADPASATPEEELEPTDELEAAAADTPVDILDDTSGDALEDTERESVGPVDSEAADMRSSEPRQDSAVSVCDPDQPFIFGHAPSGREVVLTRCIANDETPRLLDAPKLSNALVLLLQKHLNALGFDAGPEDGFIGPLTHEAIRRFQMDRGLAPTGAITFDLLDRLQETRQNP
jgi:hydrogenase-4 component B